MQRLSDAMPRARRRLEEARHAAQARRQQLIEEHNLPESVQCAHCGDTGELIGAYGTDCHFCETGRMRHEETERLKAWVSSMPGRYRHYTLGQHPDRAAAAQVRAWIPQALERGTNLLIQGHVGVGKTGLAIGALREIHGKGKRVHWGTAPSLLSEIRAAEWEDKHRLMERMQGYQVLLIDDVGTENKTSFVDEQMHLVFDGRYTKGRATIVTTNLSMEELYGALGERVMSRFRQDYVSIVMTGNDRRMQNGRSGPTKRGQGRTA